MKKEFEMGKVWTILSAFMFLVLCGFIVYAANSERFDSFKSENINNKLTSDNWNFLMDTLNVAGVSEGAVMFFYGNSCPDGWSQLESAAFCDLYGDLAAADVTYCVKGDFSSIAINCGSGQYWSQSDCACQACDDGTWSNGHSTSCAACTGKPDHASWTSNGGSQNECSWECDGGYSLENGECVAIDCNPMEFYSVDAGGCLACANGTWSNGHMASCEAIDCNPKYYWNVSEEQCKPCVNGRWSDGHMASCLACAGPTTNATWTSNGSSQNGCSWECNEGYYLDDNQCNECVNGYCTQGTFFTCEQSNNDALYLFYRRNGRRGQSNFDSACELDDSIMVSVQADVSDGYNMFGGAWLNSRYSSIDAYHDYGITTFLFEVPFYSIFDRGAVYLDVYRRDNGATVYCSNTFPYYYPDLGIVGEPGGYWYCNTII